MNQTPTERLMRQAGHARLGWRRARADAQARERALRWMEEHSCGVPEVDEIWRRALLGEGPLAEWLASDEPLEAWGEELPLRCLLSSHPFPDLFSWSSQVAPNPEPRPDEEREARLEALPRAVIEGEESGVAGPLDMEAIRRRAREEARRNSS